MSRRGRLARDDGAWPKERIMKTRTGLVVLGLSVAAFASEPGQIAVSQVSAEAYATVLEDRLYTRAGDNRGYGAEHDLARENITTMLEDYGLDVQWEPFQYNSVTYYNVVATMWGTTWPDSEFIVGAHFDSVNNPGADDNGSGTALMLEAARIISQYESDYTIRFIAFDREEQGLIGSRAYVDDHRSDDILAMVSTDMVAYNIGTNSADILCGTSSRPLQDELVEAAQVYGDGLGSNRGGRSYGSDHAPFESAGFEGCLFIEDWGNPFYHTQRDNVDEPDYLDYEFAARMTRAIVGWLVDAAGVQVEMGCLRNPAWLCDGDVDGDAQVNPVDAGLVQAAFGSFDEQDLCNYDMDCDGQINPVDSGIVQALFGTCDMPRDVCP
jgi:hypothetical protein